MSPHHNPCFHSNHLLIPQPFTRDLKLVFPKIFSTPFIQSTVWFHLDCRHRFRTWTGLTGNWHLFVLVSSYRLCFWLCVLDYKLTILSAFQSTLNSLSHISYRAANKMYTKYIGLHSLPLFAPAKMIPIERVNACRRIMRNVGSRLDA